MDAYAPASGSPIVNRRHFLAQTSTALAGSVALGSLSAERAAHAAGTELLKVALIGCGKRGAGAVSQALSTDGPIKLVAMADAYSEPLENSLAALKKTKEGKVEVPQANRFIGLDAYKQAISQCDVAILTAPPGFRAQHFEEAVRQGKHVFMEKPVATDAPSVRRIIEIAAEAKKKNLKVGVGLQRHHKPGYIEAVKRIQDGACGELHTLRCNWLGNARDGLERKPGETEMQYQIRNWYFYTWLSGDHIVEQHVHNIDVIHWIKGTHPIRAQGMGGRQVRTDKRFGQIFDHHFVEFEFADGSRCYSQSRQIRGTFTDVSEHVTGTKGSADLINDRAVFAITGANPWRFQGSKDDPYQIEHDHLFAAIRQDKPYNEAEYAAHSTLMGIMGRMATYSGKMVEWDEAYNSKLELVPPNVTWDTPPPIGPNPDGFYPVAMPGHTVAL